jgi:hypothetical protein
MAKPSSSRIVGQSDRQDDEIVVFLIVRESTCAECGAKLLKGSFLRIEGKRSLCLTCADLDHLVFLPRGDTALTRRASKYSTLRPIVLRFSRPRRRYERQGVLVEEAALERAERECLADAEARERSRARAALHRDDQDAQYVKEFAERLSELFPACPVEERQAIADHACQKYSGRVGRSASARNFNPKAIELAVRAHVRHNHTNYDQLLARGMTRMDARDAVGGVLDDVMMRWRSRS